MADDVAHVINSGVGVVGREGIAIINTNSFKIVPSDRGRMTTPSGTVPLSIGTLSDASLSGTYVNRFDDVDYYSA
jgi:hypothetical protein